jgi:hypothetical protein
MTDRETDDLLRADGDRWRAAQPPPPEPDVERLLEAAERRAAPRWIPLAAAAAVVALVAGAVTVANLRSSPESGGTPVAMTGTDDLVHDGDLVVGQGGVVALPGRPVQLCPPQPTATIAIYPPQPPAPCQVAVTIQGLDLDLLSHREERDGAVWGYARVEGVYRAGTLTVTRQESYVDPPRVPASAADRVPCPEPAGGWRRQPAEEALTPMRDRLSQLIHQHPTRFNDLYIRYPYGWHLQDTSNRKGTEVYVVGTVGDVAEARSMLTAVFPAEHLCVTRATWSMADMRAAQTRLQSAEARRVGVSMVLPDVINDRVVADVLLLDDAATEFLASVAGGRVVAKPILRPVG